MRTFWLANNSSKTWDLISELEDPQNAILLDKQTQNNQESKKEVAARIGQKLFPDEDLSIAIGRVQSKAREILQWYNYYYSKKFEGNKISYEAIVRVFPFFPRIHVLLTGQSLVLANSQSGSGSNELVAQEVYSQNDLVNSPKAPASLLSPFNLDDNAITTSRNADASAPATLPEASTSSLPSNPNGNSTVSSQNDFLKTATPSPPPFNANGNLSSQKLDPATLSKASASSRPPSSQHISGDNVIACYQKAAHSKGKEKVIPTVDLSSLIAAILAQKFSHRKLENLGYAFLAAASDPSTLSPDAQNALHAFEAAFRKTMDAFPPTLSSHALKVLDEFEAAALQSTTPRPFRPSSYSEDTSTADSNTSHYTQRFGDMNASFPAFIPTRNAPILRENVNFCPGPSSCGQNNIYFDSSQGYMQGFGNTGTTFSASMIPDQSIFRENLAFNRAHFGNTYGAVNSSSSGALATVYNNDMNMDTNMGNAPYPFAS